jgi:hypothetical protein
MRVLLAASIATLVTAAAAAGSSAPRVVLAGADPAVVTGSGFAARAHVVVAYHSGATSMRRPVVASRTGTFRLVLARVAFKRCDGLTLTAGAARLRVASCALGGHPEISGNPGGEVAGSAFVPGERVVVTAKLGTRAPVTSTVVAGSRGAFQAQLPLTPQACSQLELRATGSLGSTATYVLPAPDCMQP